MYSESDLLPISALPHLIFCERRCALVHLEQQWEENIFTVQGHQMHEKVHAEKRVERSGVRIERGMPLRSMHLGLVGKADVIEFHQEKGAANGWKPFPVEYKRGKPKRDSSDEVQLCAQALCLEEMLNIGIPQGALFYGKTRHREDVLFDAELRDKTIHAAKRLHELIASGITPKAFYEPKCDSCSLFGLCLPKVTSKNSSTYLSRIIREAV